MTNPTTSAQLRVGATTPNPAVAGGRIDVPTVLADLQAAVAERGDGYVYKPPNDESGECVYIEEGPDGEAVPSCIVGHVLARHGLLARAYALNNVALSGMWEDRDDLIEDFTPQAIAVLAKAQEIQDKGTLPWGDALIAAKEVAATQVGDGK